MKQICVKCLKELNNPKKIKIKPLGYGSLFDECGTEFCLCEDCYNEHKEWWDLEQVVEKELFEKTGYVFNVYKHEEEIKDRMDNLPIIGQEIVYNSNWYDMNYDSKIDSNLWVVNKLNNG